MQQDNNLEIFQFGSSLISNKSNDVDILLIYNENQILSSEIYKRIIKPLKKELTILYGKKIHFTCLNRNEEKKCVFLSKISAKKIEYCAEYFV